MLKKGKLFLVVLLTCFLLGNTFGSIAVNAAGNSASQAAQTVGTMAKSDEYKAFWFSYYDYDAYRTKYKKRNASTFKKYFTKVVKKGKSLGMNCIIVQSARLEMRCTSPNIFRGPNAFQVNRGRIRDLTH